MTTKPKSITSLAPGRVCLFGDHQDYLALPIIASAIDRFIQIKGVENNEGVFNIALPDINQVRIIDYKSSIDNVENGDHLRSVIKVLRNYNCIPNRGYDIEISGNLPINAGLSSSSAVVVAWVNFLIEAFGIDHKPTPELIAQIAYEAEVLEMKSSGGKMDQYSISIGDIIYLETTSDSYFEKIPAQEMSLIIGESGVPKATTKVLKELKEKTWRAINYVEKNIEGFSIENAQVDELSKLIIHIPQNLRVYFEAAVKNHGITKMALEELKANTFQVKRLGDLMNQHHAILRDCLNLSVPKIEDMINAALEANAFGAKIVGSGKGGSIVALSEIGHEDKIINKLMEAGAVNAYKATIEKGASIIKNNPQHA